LFPVSDGLIAHAWKSAGVRFDENSSHASPKSVRAISNVDARLSARRESIRDRSRTTIARRRYRPSKKARATWVEPVLLANIEYRDITSESLLRQSSFKGMSRKER
jgi:bifunctional non-homologous end joining protein LigD